jgi:hypothetical protein
MTRFGFIEPFYFLSHFSVHHVVVGQKIRPTTAKMESLNIHDIAEVISPLKADCKD